MLVDIVLMLPRKLSLSVLDKIFIFSNEFNIDIAIKACLANIEKGIHPYWIQSLIISFILILFKL